MKVSAEEQAIKDLEAVKASFVNASPKKKIPLSALFKPALRLVLLIGVVVAILQQITGINAVFFYAPMIFEQSGIGADASFSQAILVGLTNLVFTILAMLFIDRFGRKVLLVFGLTGIAISMFVLSWGFHQATYSITDENIELLSEKIDKGKLQILLGESFNSDIAFKQAIVQAFGTEDAKTVEADLMAVATNMNALLILLGIVGFVASFAISLGPVMWVLFSEIFPNAIRGIAISFVGFINSGISFLVQLIFPWELATLGSSVTFLIYGLFAAIGLLIIILVLPETKNKSLEDLEIMLQK
jgi:MFS transporter, SP family, arabinose:H+ symporter